MSRRNDPANPGRYAIWLAVLPVLAAASCGGGDGGGGSALGNAFCDKAEMCQGAPLSSADRRQCVQLAGVAFGVPPDPESAVACLTGTACADLEADPEGIVTACLDIDPTSYRCEGSSLHLCTNGGVCNQVDCPSFCRELGFAFVACDLSQADGFDQCLCGA